MHPLAGSIEMVFKQQTEQLGSTSAVRGQTIAHDQAKSSLWVRLVNARSKSRLLTRVNGNCTLMVNVQPLQQNQDLERIFMQLIVYRYPCHGSLMLMSLL